MFAMLSVQRRIKGSGGGRNRGGVRRRTSMLVDEIHHSILDFFQMFCSVPKAVVKIRWLKEKPCKTWLPRGEHH